MSIHHNNLLNSGLVSGLIRLQMQQQAVNQRHAAAAQELGQGGIQDNPYQYNTALEHLVYSGPNSLVPADKNTKVNSDGNITTKKGENMLTEIVQDLKKFVTEHKSTIYVIAFLLLVDHFAFNGAFKAKLKGMMEKMIGKVEQQLSGPETPKA